MTAGWCSRTLRAAVFAAVCVPLAALGHVLMSGNDVPAWVLAAGLAATGTVGWCLAGRERGLPLIVAVVVAAQTVLHEAFSLAQSSSGGAASNGMKSMDMGSMHMGSMHMGSMQMGSMPMDSMDMGSMPMDSMDMGHMDMGRMPHTGPMAHSMDGWGSSYGMLAAHLLAALLTGLWLAYGEKAAFRILRAVAARLAAPLRLLLALPPALDRPRVHPRRPRSDRAPSLRLLVHAITSRGPPAGTAVV
ncbi:hypothetical protein [Streptomyces spinosisporus]|uniref:Integral-membrane protein n=1 Tax=Streptomyces spinosisporus TaxID=2927582 RepID=A0ABS9XA27_9ACTN|nr:hypothetical protein [Streptomyces spinosisporus]MCI3238904.1 hypothetical protein [Streptomyces spinosisporus]